MIRRAQLWQARRAIAAILAAMLAALVLAAALLPGYVATYGVRLWYTAFRIFADPQNLLSGRLQTWRELFDFLVAHPWHLFLGIGYKTLPHTTFAGRPLIADNMYLSILVETGILGLLAMLLLCAAILGASARAMLSANTSASFLGAWSFCFWIGQLVQMLSIDVMTFWRVLPLYLGLLGMAVHRANRVAGQRQP
jgi:O-antigen ligase